MSKYQIMLELTMVSLSDVSGNFCDESVANENVSHAAVHLKFGHIRFRRCMQTEKPLLCASSSFKILFLWGFVLFRQQLWIDTVVFFSLLVMNQILGQIMQYFVTLLITLDTLSVITQKMEYF